MFPAAPTAFGTQEVFVDEIPAGAVYSHNEWYGSQWASIYRLPNGEYWALVHGEYSF